MPTPSDASVMSAGLWGATDVAEDLAFDALADGVRREILTVLAEQDECSAGELAARIQRVGRTAVSSHLRVLRVAGLISERRTGRFRYYSIDPTGAAQDVLRMLTEVFRQSLAATKIAAEAGNAGNGITGDGNTANELPGLRASS